MATYSFVFTNTNPDQVFDVEDTNAATSTHIGPVNHGDPSPPCQCWIGGDGKGRVIIVGSVSGRFSHDVEQDNDTFDY